MNLKGVLLTITLAAGFVSCSGPSTGAAAEDSATVTCYPGEDSAATTLRAEMLASEVQKEESPDLTRWQYKTEMDEMTDKDIHLASVMSENEVEFDFPYEGGTRMFLALRDSPQYGKDIFIKITQGQFMSNFSGQTIKMRFDDDDPISVNCQGASDYSSDILFLTGYKKIVDRLRTSKKVRIAAEFFNEGIRTFTFDTEGLEWNY